MSGIHRRAFIGSGLSFAIAGCRKKVPRADVHRLSLVDLVREIREGRMSAGEVLDLSLKRIAAIDRAGPRLGAVLELNPEARAAAEKTLRGALAGIPILIKDNIETADQMETTAGSLALLGAPKPAQDATVVRRLREAGAIILGKTNLSEWGNIRSPNSTSGWSARGMTVNPYNSSHSASGSSSGSAAAVAAGYCAAALGTETNGSIISPAAACGIVGLKPTLGLVSRAGIIPISGWQDTAGPMTRTVRDAAMVLSVLAGRDERDEKTQNAKATADYALSLTAEGLKGKRLGVLRASSGSNKAVKRLFQQSLDRMQAAGAVLVEDVTVPNYRDASSAAWVALLTELRQDLNGYLSARGGVVKSLAELIAYNEEFRTQEMRHFNQEFFVEAETRGTPEHLAAAEEQRQVARRLAGPEGLDAVLEKHRLDALVCPTNDPAGRIDLGMGDAPVRTVGGAAAVAGYPHLTVPMGMVSDLPVGLSFIGPAWSEELLLRLGHAYEGVRGFEPADPFA